MNEPQDIKAVGAKVLNDITVLARDTGTLFAAIIERAISFVKSARDKRKEAQPATEKPVHN